MELMIMGLQIILFLFLTIGVFCIFLPFSQACPCVLYCAATEKSKPVQKTPGIVLKKTHGQAWEKGRKKCITGESAK